MAAGRNKLRSTVACEEGIEVFWACVEGDQGFRGLWVYFAVRGWGLKHQVIKVC